MKNDRNSVMVNAALAGIVAASVLTVSNIFAADKAEMGVCANANNSCKGNGACGESKGKNDCKGHGGAMMSKAKCDKLAGKDKKSDHTFTPTPSDSKM